MKIDSHININGFSRKFRGNPSIFIFVVLAGAMLLGGCKTTVKNYQEAYDVAIQKQQRDEEERAALQREMGVDVQKLQDVEGFRRENVGGRMVWTIHERFSRTDSLQAYSACVATFKMPANAEAVKTDLLQKGLKCVKTCNAKDKYYVIIETSDDPKNAALALEAFGSKFKQWPYVGQPGEVVIIGGSR